MKQLDKIDARNAIQASSDGFFDPRVITEDGKSRRVWTSESVELANKGLREGYKLLENPYLRSVKGYNLRKSGISFKPSGEEMEVMEAIMDDKLWFCNNFLHLKDEEKGWIQVKMRDYQSKLLSLYDTEKWNIVMFPRQSGKTTTTIGEILHFVLTNIDKDIVCIAQSDKVVREIRKKLLEAFSKIPFFMQPGCIAVNKEGFMFDNGCRITVGIAAESVVQGYALDFLYIDEFAYIKNTMVRKFWNNIYPTLINNPKSKCIITSTPNGRNLFWELWVGSEMKNNRFHSYRIYWYDVPGRDEKFKQDTIVNMGLEGWEMGFECSFDTQLKSVFGIMVQKALRASQLVMKEEWATEEGTTLDGFEMLSRDTCDYDFKRDYFLIGIDIAEGLEQDSSTIKIRKMEWDKNLKKLTYRSVGVFHDNNISVEDLAIKVMVISRLFDPGKVKVIVENNTYGGEFFTHMRNLRNHDRDYFDFNMDIIAKFIRDSKGDYEYGIRRSRKNKPVDVKSFTSLVSNNIMIESNNTTIEEYLNFGRKKDNTYAANYGHDDLVMADVAISHFIKSNDINCREFLKMTEGNLRCIANDEDQEVLAKKAAEAMLKDIYVTSNGFKVRDHEEEYARTHGSDECVYM